jgi:predicted RNA-binding Zn ribbon-like protein
MTLEQAAGDFRDGMPFFGGRLWIDFLNTTPVIDGVRQDLIENDDLLRRWAKLAGIDVSSTGNRDSIEDLRALRAFLQREFDRLAGSGRLSSAALTEINRRIEQSGSRLKLVQNDDAVGLLEHAVLVGPPVATAVAWDLARFLGDFEPARLRHCDNPACTMQFYDCGKNNRRRWCTMSICGNRDKVANYRARKAGSAARAEPRKKRFSTPR